MDIANFFCAVEEQERGRWCPIFDMHGNPTDIRMKVAGPDSEVQRRARHLSIDDLRSKSRAREGRALVVSAEDEEAIAIDMLARSVLTWEGLEDDGKPMECSHENLIRVFKRFPWVRHQIDSFASSRVPYVRPADD